MSLRSQSHWFTVCSRTLRSFLLRSFLLHASTFFRLHELLPSGQQIRRFARERPGLFQIAPGAGPISIAYPLLDSVKQTAGQTSDQPLCGFEFAQIVVRQRSAGLIQPSRLTGQFGLPYLPTPGLKHG